MLYKVNQTLKKVYAYFCHFISDFAHYPDQSHSRPRCCPVPAHPDSLPCCCVWPRMSSAASCWRGHTRCCWSSPTGRTSPGSCRPNPRCRTYSLSEASPPSSAAQTLYTCPLNNTNTHESDYNTQIIRMSM